MRHLLAQALDLVNQLDLFFIKWIPSSENKSADQLARRAIRLNKERKSEQRQLRKTKSDFHSMESDFSLK